MATIKNKIVFGGETLIDLSQDTVNTENVLAGVTFHGPTGEILEGTCTYDADTSDATALASEIVSGKTAYVHGNEVTGTMPNVGAQTASISTVNQTITPSVGYHDGSGSIGIDAVEKAKIIPGNIAQGTTILGVIGTHQGGGDVEIQANKNATPSTSQQVILPDAGYDALGQVTVAAIPYTETLNAGGGYTATIG